MVHNPVMLTPHSGYTLFYKGIVIFQDIGKSITGIVKSPIGMKYEFFCDIIGLNGII